MGWSCRFKVKDLSISGMPWVWMLLYVFGLHYVAVVTLVVLLFIFFGLYCVTGFIPVVSSSGVPWVLMLLNVFGLHYAAVFILVVPPFFIFGWYCLAVYIPVVFGVLASSLPSSWRWLWAATYVAVFPLLFMGP